jgi:putative salt-induced outer membrane protein
MSPKVWRFTLFPLLAAPSIVLAQQPGDLMTEVELGATFTTGNTEERTVRYGVTMDWLRNNWEYQFTSDGLLGSREGDTTAQRFYHVARGRRELSDITYLEIRGSYEDDRFSGYDYQADLTASYGRSWLHSIDNMSLDTDIGPGYRRSESPEEDRSEVIVRLAGEYEWGISDTANFYQNVAMEFGQDSDIYRSETGVESEIMENISLRFSINIKHQTEVPFGKEKTDTQSAVTLVWNF